eukprot:CCRYP_012665-RC/>CCRYP_012665-RC protein AED:0.42 eAED:0.42 QI:611/1/1/1/0/0/2/55/135
MSSTYSFWLAHDANRLTVTRNNNTRSPNDSNRSYSRIDAVVFWFLSSVVASLIRLTRVAREDFGTRSHSSKSHALVCKHRSLRAATFSEKERSRAVMNWAECWHKYNRSLGIGSNETNSGTKYPRATSKSLIFDF